MVTNNFTLFIIIPLLLLFRFAFIVGGKMRSHRSWSTGEPVQICRLAERKQDGVFNALTTSSRRLILMGPAVFMQIFFTWLWLESRAYRVWQRALPVWNQTSQQRGLIEISPRNRKSFVPRRQKKNGSRDPCKYAGADVSIRCCRMPVFLMNNNSEMCW